MIHQDAFAWDDSEHSHFRKDFFPPVEIPTVPHTPWRQCNIPIPPGIYDLFCETIQCKMNAGVFEPSNSSYQSHIFGFLKKDGKALCIIHALAPV